MAWQTMIPTPGGRRAEEIVTLACRDNSHGAARHYNWIVTLSGSLRAKLRWPERLMVTVENHPTLGMTRLTPTDDKSIGWAMTLNKTALQAVLPLLDEGVMTVPATRIPFEISGDALLLTLPTWAGGRATVEQAKGRAPRGRAAVKAKQTVTASIPAHVPPLPTAPQFEREHLRDALLMLRGGATTLSVMEKFSWTREKVEHLRRNLAALRRTA